MAFDYDDSIFPAATVLPTDLRTGLPTLVHLCVDLETLLRLTTPLTLVSCLLESDIEQFPQSPAFDQAALIMGRYTQEQTSAQVYRVGTHGLILLLPSVQPHDAMALAQNLRTVLAQELPDVRVIIAVASSPSDAATTSDLLVASQLPLLGDAAPGDIVRATPREYMDAPQVRLATVLQSQMEGMIALGAQLVAYEQMALHDSITNLPNGRAFEKVLPRYIDRCAHEQSPLCLVMIDGDNLKHYNNAYGYEAGNQWISTLAQILAEHLRPGDYIARWLMGDEFVVLLPDTTPEQARDIAERLRIAVASTSATMLRPGTVSAGVTEIDLVKPAKTALGNARLALIEAKQRGKNTAVLYT